MRYLIFYLTALIIITACQKESSLDNNVTGAAGSLVKTSSGDCAPVSLSGMFIQNTVLNASNYMDVQVNFTVLGDYEIKSDTVNGYSFKASGQATATGAQTIRLHASGKPVIAGTNALIIRFNTSVCQANVVVSASPSVYIFGNIAGVCTGATLAGIYTTGIALVSANTVGIQVTVSSPGSYSISTTAVNGISFSSSGSFNNTGLQTVTLTGSGTAAAAGTFNFITALSGGCTFSVVVSNPTSNLAQLTTTATTSVTCTAALPGGNITSDGGTPVTARGICYGTISNPTTANMVVNSGSGTGLYTSNIFSLSPGTTYHARAFATNSSGTSYGNDISFTTLTGCTTSIFVTGWHDVYNISGDIRTPKVWKNSTGSYAGTALPFTLNGGSVEANSIYVSGTDVYVAGRENGKATLWKNGVATALSTAPSPPFYYEGYANAVYVVGTDVYVAGSYANEAKIWKNGVATTIGTGVIDAVARSVVVSGTDVYAAGFTTQIINSNVAYIATMWKNGVASYLTNGPTSADANSIYISGTDVYVVGKEGNAAKLWKNGVASTLSSLGKAVANSVVVSGIDVYVAGWEDDGISLDSYAKLWKNGAGSFLTTSGYRNRAWSVFVIGPDVYVAGSKSTGGANTYAGVWRNGFFTPVDGGSTDAAAYSIFVK